MGDECFYVLLECTCGELNGYLKQLGAKGIYEVEVGFESNFKGGYTEEIKWAILKLKHLEDIFEILKMEREDTNDKEYVISPDVWSHTHYHRCKYEGQIYGDFKESKFVHKCEWYIEIYNGCR